MAKGVHCKFKKRMKREKIKNRLAKLQAVQKAKDEGTYIPKPWENRPLIQELYSFAIKSHRTAETKDRTNSNSDDNSMDLELPGTPKSIDHETASVASKDGASSVTSQSSKYSLRNIEQQLVTKLSKNKFPDWLTRKERRKMVCKMRTLKKLKETPRFKRIRRKIAKRDAEKNAKKEKSQDTSEPSDETMEVMSTD